MRGWTAYFGISQYYRPVPELDEWIRRRKRMCY
ncbi:group II intron maturase-specific domain-containing protein [Candidatus Symbiobacter mobilis]